MEECVFCKIRDGIIPSEKIAENSGAFAIYDIRPISKGHALIIPKKHVETIFELEKEECAQVFELLKEVKLKIDKEFAPKAYNVAANCGREAGQIVMHAHLHLIPRHVAGKGTEEYLREKIESE